MIGDFVSQLPGNQQDLSLPGSRAAFQAPHTVLPNTQDWMFIESIGRETGRFDMNGPLPGRYYGMNWTSPRGYLFPAGSMVSQDAGVSPNSGAGFDVASSIYSDMGVVGGDSSAFAAPVAPSPAASVAAASQTGQAIGPITLTTPMPSVLQPRRNQVTDSQMDRGLSGWVCDHPLLAAGIAVSAFFLVRGSK